MNNFVYPVHKKTVKTVKKWDTIGVMYVGTLDDGSVFDTNITEKAKEAWIYNEGRSYTPLEFTVWAWEMIPGFDSGVVWMKLNETKKIHIVAEDAYGSKRKQLIKYFSWALLDEQWAPRKDRVVGEKYVFQTSAWPQIWVLTKKDNVWVTIDFNHELAWKDLNFEITVVSIK